MRGSIEDRSVSVDWDFVAQSFFLQSEASPVLDGNDIEHQ